MTWPSHPLTWFITGASSGFGRALSRIALSHGHTVIGTCRDPSRYPTLLSEFQPPNQLLPLDLTDPKSADTINRLESQGTQIDVFVNSAGQAMLGALESFEEEEVRAQMELLHFGPSRLVRAVVPHMRRRRRGMILNVSTGAALDGRESMAVYGSSKAAFDGMLRVLAKEIAPFNIRTLTVLLGAFDTSFSANVQKPRTPYPKENEDYKGSMVEMICNSNGTAVLGGDHQKACKVMYEMVMGEGFGKGKEDERVMALGKDMWTTVERVDGQFRHMMDVFGEIAHNVAVDQ